MQDVIVFGKGRYYRSKMNAISEKYNVIAFLDNTVKPGSIFTGEDGIPVYNPEVVKKIKEIPILTMSAKYFEMWEQLISLGIEDKRILFGISLEPYYDEIEKKFGEQRVEVYSENKKLVLKIGSKNKYCFENEGEYKRIIREIQQELDLSIRMFSDMPLRPLSRRCGVERGTPIDRYYIEKFIASNQKCIRGITMEVADNYYTKKFGLNVEKSLTMHVEGWGKDVIQINLETGKGVLDNSIECFICTQTIQMIYDIKAAVYNIYRMLKPGGIALITIAGIAGLSLYDYYNWGEYWRGTPKAIKKLFEEIFEEDNIKIVSYGNVKTTIAFLYGMCIEDLRENDFLYDDEQFPLLLGCVVRK